MKHKKNIILIISLAFFLLFSPFLTLILGSKIRDFFFREFCYTVILRKITKESDSDVSVANKIFKYVCKNVGEPNKNTIPIDSNPFEVLVSGKGSCDQQSNLIITLGSYLDVKGYLIYLYMPKSNTSTHSICMLKTIKEMLIFDPFYKKKIDNQIFSKPNIKENDLFKFRKFDLKKNMDFNYNRCKFLNNNNVSFERKLIRKYSDIWILFFEKSLFKSYLNLFFTIDKTISNKEKKIKSILFQIKLWYTTWILVYKLTYLIQSSYYGLMGKNFNYCFKSVRFKTLIYLGLKSSFNWKTLIDTDRLLVVI